MERPDDLLERARALDAADPLASQRDHWCVPKRDDQEIAYFCGNSLGLQARATAGDLQVELDAWAGRAVDGHFEGPHPWFSYHEDFAAPLARVVGALPHEVVCMGSLSNNLHLLLVSFYRPSGTRRRILIEAGAFPSDHHIAVSQILFHGGDPSTDLMLAPQDPASGLVDEDALCALIEREAEHLAVVMLSGVQFRTGQLFDIERITRATQAAGAISGWDLAHAAGNVELALHAWNVDFAAWCSYKYLNGGPGATAGLFVHDRHARRDDLPRFAGWWGHEPSTRFAMEGLFTPQLGAPGWQLSNAPVFGMAPLRAPLRHFDAVGMPRLVERSRRLTTFLLEGLEPLLGGLVHVITPAEPGRRGAQTSLRITQDAPRIQRALQEAGVVGDFRPPDVVRIAPAPLYNNHQDIARFLIALRSLA